MFCSNCGAMAQAAALFCQKCGHSLNGETPSLSNANFDDLGVARATNRVAGIAIAALVSAFVIPLLGILIGGLARREIRESKGSKGGDGVATTAIVLGWLFTSFWFFLLVVIVIAAFDAATYA